MSDLLLKIKQIVGDSHVLDATDWAIAEPAWNTHQPCLARAVVLPADTAEVSEILKLCHADGQSVVPYGGRTNLVQACATTENDIALSFERMNRIEETDASARTMIAEAGVTMRQAQDAAEAADLFFPVDIGARDVCAVGGFVSTNAGGNKVIRYGMTRDSVLGLEAVLADGTIVSSMNRYIKNNSGFDLKQLFIGTEGALGVITRVVFRLGTRSTTHNVALVACPDYSSIVKVLQRSQQLLGDNLSGFEVMWDNFYRRATKPLGRQDSPFDEPYPIYAIIESMGVHPATDDDQFAAALEAIYADDILLDAVLAKSERERTAIWAIRDEVEWLVTDAQNFDVSLRTLDVEDYVAGVRERLLADLPDAEIATFGHLGDNNLHVSVISNSERADSHDLVEKHIYESLRPYQGAVSAEHGIGLEKKAWLAVTRSEQELAMMRTLKTSLDPGNILNPGKVFEL
jgi:FAD/FMN-containing dehydrogenase